MSLCLPLTLSQTHRGPSCQPKSIRGKGPAGNPSSELRRHLPTWPAAELKGGPRLALSDAVSLTGSRRALTACM